MQARADSSAPIAKALNQRGVTKIIAVDNFTKADKFKNLVDCEIADYLDKHDSIERIQAGHFDGDIDAIFHEGACSDTMETDGRYMMGNNCRYSMILLDWCMHQDVQFLYASSAATYGGSSIVREDRSCEAPPKVYGYSKFLFDQGYASACRRPAPRSSASAISTSFGPTTRSSFSRGPMATPIKSNARTSSSWTLWPWLPSTVPGASGGSRPSA